MNADYYTISLPRIVVPEGHKGNMLAVDRDSPRSLVAVVERFGRYLQRENGYDFPQSLGNEERSKAYLFLLGRQAIGAIVFDFPADEFSINRYGARWWLEWVWIHPFERRKKWLSGSFPHFETELGKFFINPPFSEAMRKFLLKRGKCTDCWEPATILDNNCKCNGCVSKNRV